MRRGGKTNKYAARLLCAGLAGTSSVRKIPSVSNGTVAPVQSLRRPHGLGLRSFVAVLRCTNVTV